MTTGSHGDDAAIPWAAATRKNAGETGQDSLGGEMEAENTAKQIARAIWSTVPHNGKPVDFGNLMLCRRMVDGELGYTVHSPNGTATFTADEETGANALVATGLGLDLPTEPTDVELTATEAMKRDVFAASENMKDEYFDADPRAKAQRVRREMLRMLSSMLAVNTPWHDTFVRALRESGIDLSPLEMDPVELKKYEG